MTKGVTYKYQYRARNINGWGDFSDYGYLFAADVPAKPQAPMMTAVNDTSISIQLFTPKDTGENDILLNEIWIDSGI